MLLGLASHGLACGFCRVLGGRIAVIFGRSEDELVLVGFVCLFQQPSYRYFRQEHAAAAKSRARRHAAEAEGGLGWILKEI